MTPMHSMRASLTDPELLGHVLTGDSWYSWRVLLIAAGEELTEDERKEFARLTGRDHEP
jgi:hypothetical protein